MSTGMAAVVAATDSISNSDHEKAVATAHAAGRAEGEASGRESGASAERARILGIEAHALKGHEKLVAECKADPTCTPDMAAGRILAAENKLRADQLAGIVAVEDLTGKVGAAAASQRQDGGAPQPPQAGIAKPADQYKADWAKSAELQADFATADAYANYAKGVAEGRIRVLAKKTA